MYGIRISPRARKYLKKLRKKDKPLREKIDNAITDIQSDPYVAGTLKTGDLSGVYGYDVYHQGTNYEIAYTVERDDEGNIVLLILAGSRENFYEELKRYWT